MFTHDDLTKRAERWLLKTMGCGFVLKELRCYSDTMETPDVIGWQHHQSILVECKANRADYFADDKKIFRQRYKWGMGNYRYYLVPPNMIAINELRPRWGLLYCYKNQIRIIKQAEFISKRHSGYREIPILVSALRRVHLRGDLKKIYNRTSGKTGQPW